MNSSHNVTCQQPRNLGKNWSEFVGALRFLSGKTLSEFSETISVGSDTIARWEGGGKPQRRYREEFAALFDLSNDEITMLNGGVTAASLAVKECNAHTSDVFIAPEGGPFEQILGAFVYRIANGPPINETEGTILREALQSLSTVPTSSSA